MKRGDIQALATAVKNAWDTRLSEEAFKNVYERLQNVLVMIDETKEEMQRWKKSSESSSASSNFEMTLHLMLMKTDSKTTACTASS
jgi:cell shape-determining protein MreC